MPGKHSMCSDLWCAGLLSLFLEIYKQSLRIFGLRPKILLRKLSYGGGAAFGSRPGDIMLQAVASGVTVHAGRLAK